MLPIVSASRTTPKTPPPDSPEKIANAAHQFESLLIDQMLRAMREGGTGGWMSAGEDKSSESLMEYAEQEFARVMAAGGGFGLARMLAEGLSGSRAQD